MATTNLNIRTDKAIKDQAEEIFNELGLNMTTAVNMFLRAASAESRARRLFYRKNFRCSDSRSGLQMAMTINISPSTTPATIG